MALKPAHKDKSRRRLMWPRPIFVLQFSLRSHQSMYDPPPIFIFQSISFVFLRSVQQLLLLQSCLCFLSPPTLPSHCAPFSFIHILLPQQQSTESSRRAAALPHYDPFLRFYLHSSSFPSSGDLLLSLPLSPCTPPSFSCVGAFLSLLFFPRSCAPHCSPPPPQFALSTFFISPSLRLVSFCFPPQSLVMRCDKPLPCYHSNRVPVATQQQCW